MEALLVLFPVLCGGATIVALIAAALVWGVRRSKARMAAFAASVRALGLTPHGEREASGVRDGIGVRIVLTTESRGSGKNRRQVSVTRYYAGFDPPLRMGLEVHEQTAIFGELLDFAGLSSDIELGDRALDAALRIRALEPDHARAILRSEGVQAPVLAACAAGRFAISDASAFLQHDQWAVEQQAIASRLEPLWAVARSVSEARRRWRASWEQALDASWGGLAATDGLAYDATRSRLHGRAGESVLSVEIHTERGGLVTRASASFGAPLGIGLRVYRTGVAQNIGKLFGAQDVQVGVPAFDALYTVKATDAAAARAALAEGGADAIMKLQSIASDVTADDTGVQVRVDGILHDARAVATLVRALGEAARSMRPGGPVSMGAFR